MKVFDVKIGDKKVLKDVDPFLFAGSKLTPADVFLDVQIANKKLTVDGVPIKGGIKDE